MSGIVRGFPGSPVLGLVADATEAEALAGNADPWPRWRHDGHRCPRARRMEPFRAAFNAGRSPNPLTTAMACAIVKMLTTEPGPRMDGAQSEVDTAAEVCAVSDGLVGFFRALFASDISHARGLGTVLGVEPSTLVSRFYRAGSHRLSGTSQGSLFRDDCDSSSRRRSLGMTTANSTAPQDASTGSRAAGA